LRSTINGRDKLRVGYLSTLYHTSFILRATNWLKAELNIDADWKLFGGGPAIVNAFRDNEVDIGYIGLPPTMIGIDKGVSIRCVSAGHMEGTVLIGHAAHYKSLRELGNDKRSVLAQFQNKIIGSPPQGSIHDVIIRTELRSAGLEHKVLIKNFDWADFIPDAILDGEIDGAVGTPPLAVVCSRKFNSKILIPANQLWRYNPSYGIIVSTKLIEHKPELICNFLALHKRATALILSDMDKAAELIVSVIPVIDKKFALATYKISPTYCTGLPKEFIDATMAFVPVLRELGYISRELKDTEIFQFVI
jgi:NitT/TauT family transport system substrate-binding protein